MKLSSFRKPAAGVIAAFGAVLLAGCDAGGLSGGAENGEYSMAVSDPILANPEVGDLWSAKLDEFSSSEFETENGGDGDAYGLMKVINVTDQRVIVITENAALPVPFESVAELQGDLAAIVWDETEEIPINRRDLQSLLDQEYILATRRLDQ